MKRIVLSTVALVVALSPAVVGLLGNASFSGALPVRVPSSAQVVTDDSPSRTSTPSPTSTPATRSVDDHGDDRAPGSPDDHPSASPTARSTDDHGGLRTTSGRSRTMATSGSSHTSSAVDDHSGGSIGSGGSGGSGSGSSGSGSSSSGSGRGGSDHGGSGHP